MRFLVRLPVWKFALVASLAGMCLACACMAAEANRARELFEAGARAAHAGDSLKAYLFFSKAAQMEPLNKAYAARAHALQSSVAFTRPAVTEPDPALNLASSAPDKIDPAIDTVEARMVNAGLAEEVSAALTPPRLSGKAGPQSFNLRGDAQTAWTTLGEAYGLQVVFDRTYQPLPSIRADISDQEMPAAFRMLEIASDSFVVALDEHRMMVARDTVEKRLELTPTMAMAVPIPERLTVQEAQEISTAVQQVLEIRRISMDPGRRVVYFRDSLPKALAAREMFNTLSRPRAQIELEVEFLSFSKTSTLDYGFLPPTSTAIIAYGASTGALPLNIQSPTLPTGIGAATFGGGASLLALGITDSTLFDTIARASSQTLIRSSMVSLDGQAATLHVGDSYPIITNSYTSGTSSTPDPSVTPGIQFVDLGLLIKVTPTVHEGSEVTLDVDAAFKTLGTVSLNGIPEISNQQFQGKVRLKEGEWAVLAGLATTLDAPTTTGIAGLADIPILGSLFSHKTRENDVSDTLVVLKPRLVYLPPWESVNKPLWTGTESRPVTAF